MKQEGQLMLRKVRGCVSEAVCHLVVEQAFSGWFAQAMRWCACALMKAGHCVVVRARLCTIQRILPHRRCA